MGPKLKHYKKYRISNTVVRPILEKYQTEDLRLHWVISTRTIVEELDDEENPSVAQFLVH